MRLLIVSAYFETHRGGIEMVVDQLAREFRRAGLSVTWLASDASPIPPDAEASDRRVPIRAFNGTERFLGIPFPIPRLSALKTILREVTSADVVMLHDTLYPTNIAAFLLALWANRPLVVTQHIGAVPYRNPLLRGLMRLMNRMVTRPILSSASQVVFISKLTAEAFADVCYRRPPRLIFNGLDTDIFRAAGSAAERIATREGFGLAPDRPIALFVGRFVEKKGLNILCHAARLAADVDWVFAGWGSLDPRAWNLPNVHVFSELNQTLLAPLYRASDVFVLPSTGEGFPLVLQEALGCGLPAISGAETAKADDKLRPLLQTVEVEGRHPQNVAKDLVTAVRRAIRDDSPAQALSRSNQIRGWYSWSHAADLYLDIFHTADGVGDRAAPDVLAPVGTDR